MSDPYLSPLLVAVARNQRLLDRHEEAMTTRLVNAYGRIWDDLQAQLQALTDAIDAGRPKSYLETRIQTLQAQVEAEVARYAIYADGEMDYAARQALQAAMAHTPRTVAAAYGSDGDAVIRAYWHQVPTDAVEELFGMLGHNSPLYRSMSTNLGPAVAGKVGQGLLKGVALGWNPRKVQRELEKIMGQGLTWSLTSTRTAMIWSYREATRAGYMANPDIVEGWIWHSALDPFRTCLSCIVMHGTFHPNTETLNDHRSGRCTMLPKTRSWADLGFPEIPEATTPVPLGKDWFAAQPERIQRMFMGPAKYDAWRAGAVDFGDFSTTYQDDVYGPMMVEASLKGILGQRAQQYYQPHGKAA